MGPRPQGLKTTDLKPLYVIRLSFVAFMTHMNHIIYTGWKLGHTWLTNCTWLGHGLLCISVAQWVLLPRASRSSAALWKTTEAICRLHVVFGALPWNSAARKTPQGNRVHLDMPGDCLTEAPLKPTSSAPGTRRVFCQSPETGAAVFEKALCQSRIVT